MRFIGVDLAWGQRANTGLCVTESGRVLDSTSVRTDADIEKWISLYLSGPGLVAIDAPLIVRNQTGRRPCESVISRCFGRYHAGAHSSNLGLAAFRGGVRAERLARALGLDVDPHITYGRPVAPARAIEVYPHPALVALFGLPVTLKYKARAGRMLPDRREALHRLMNLLETLSEEEPPLAVDGSPRWRELRIAVSGALTGVALDRAEDEIDAYVCAYVAEYYWANGLARCRVVGDLASGYIVTPTTAVQGVAVDVALAAIAARASGATPELAVAV